MPDARLIILHDSTDLPDDVVDELQTAGFDVATVASVPELTRHARESDAPVVVVDFRADSPGDYSPNQALHRAGVPAPIVRVQDAGHYPDHRRAIATGADTLIVRGAGFARRLAGAAVEALSRNHIISRQQRWLEITALMMKTLDAGVAVIDEAGRIVYFNQAFYDHLRCLGYSADKSLAYSQVDDLIEGIQSLPVSRRRRLLEGLSKVRQREMQHFRLTYRLPEGDHPKVFRADIREVNEGRFRGTLVTIADMSQRHARRRERRQQEQLLHNIIESVDESVMVVDLDDNVLLSNENTRIAVGETPTRLDQLREVSELRWFNDNAMVEEEDYPLSRARRGERVTAEKFVYRVPGGDRILSLSAAPLKGAGGVITGGVLTARDITGQVDMEERINKARRLESVGQLAGGIAHDFNNLLTVIRGHAESLRAMLDGSACAANDLTEIDAAVAAAARLTSDLLSVGQRQTLLMTAINLNGLLRDRKSMLRTVLGDSYSLTFDLDRRNCSVEADRVRLEQAILNLVINAREAMPGGGDIVIRTRIRTLDAADGNEFGLKPARYIQLDVCDHGGGIDPSIRDNIFEPFFTTKQGAAGSGLGLSSAFGVAQQCGGTLLVDSVPGQGSTFTILLPQMNSTDAPSVPERLSDGEEKKRILLVEDSDGIRQLAERVLRVNGYEIDVAESAESALDNFSILGDYDLLVTDVVLPGMSGPAMVEQLEEKGWDKPVIFMSGYAHDHMELLRARNMGKAFLPKPFSMATLATTVSDAVQR